MHLPQPAPSQEALLKTIAHGRFSTLLARAADVSQHDQYFHWDDLRRRSPPADLNHHEWWWLLKLGRAGKRRPVPLQDTGGGGFHFTLPDSLIEQLHLIDRGLGSAWNLPEAVTSPSSRNEYVISTLIQEAITSSQLEGAVTTREVAKEMIRTGRPPRDRSERMILNNFLTMQRLTDLHSEELTPQLVFELHRRVTEGTLDQPDAAGRFRRSDENIRVVDMEGTVFHEPPPAAQLPARLESMCAFANGRAPEFFIHPVVRAIMLHFWLAYDHPFVDGNGRTARALFYWCMLHQGLRLFEFISISQILLKAPAQYAMAFLHTETDDGDLTYFLLHQADVIQRAIKALHEYVDHKMSALRRLEKAVRGMVELNHRQQALLAHALREPEARYTIEGHRNSHGVVYQTARTDLLDLTEKGLLRMNKAGRAMVFRVPADLEERLGRLRTSAVTRQQ